MIDWQAPPGAAIFIVYNRVSWLNALSKVMKASWGRSTRSPTPGCGRSAGT